MTRLAALTAAAVAAGYSAEQADELARNIAAALPAAVCDVAECAIEHRIAHGWLAPPECGVTRLAERLADAWLWPDNE